MRPDPPSSTHRVPLLGAVLASLIVHATIAVGVAGALARARQAPTREPEALTSLSGDTFEVPTDAVPDVTEETVAGAGAAPIDEIDGDEAHRPAAPHRAAASKVSPRRGLATVAGAEVRGGGSPASGSEALLFGALGDRSAAPLEQAFTRAFPQAASADPSWLSTPFGSAGTVDVELTLDEQGSLVHARVVGGQPSAALSEGLRRTLALIRARSFVAAGRRTRLRIAATVTPDQVHDGLHGDVFAIGGSFAGGEGNGFFALAAGRRVDIRLRALP